MVALAIATMLVLAGMAVLGNFRRLTAQDDEARARGAIAEGTERVLRRDIVHATAYRMTGNALDIQTRALLAPESLETRHLAATVTYRILSLEGRDWLVREQTSEHASPLKELVASNVRQIDVVGRTEDKAKRDAWLPIPPVMNVVLECASDRPEFIEISVRQDRPNAEKRP